MGINLARTKPQWGLAAKGVSIRTGSGGGGGYVAKAVHFDGNTNLHIDSLISVTSSLITLSFWIKITGMSNDNTGLIFDGANTGAGPFFQNPSSSAVYPSFSYNWADQAFTNFDSGATNGPQVFPVSTWANVMGAVNTGFAAGSRIEQYYINDAPVDFSGGSQSQTGVSFQSVFGGLNVDFPTSSSTSFVVDVADVWAAPGQFLDLTVTANRRKFIDGSGKPVSLGAAGIGPTGTAPAIFFSGDHTTFPNNQGTGGAFTLTGTLTDAATHP